MKAKAVETKIFFLSLAGILICEGVTLSVIHGSSYSPMPVLGVERMVETVFLLIVVSKLGQGLASIGLVRGTTLIGLKRGFIWSAFFGLTALLFFSVLYAFHISPFEIFQTTLPASIRERVLFFAVGGFVAPIAEEVFFRGVVYGFLRRWGCIMAVLGTTIIFVTAHSLQAGVPFPQIVGGVVFAVAYEIEGNLFVPITIHVLGNMAIFSLCLWGNIV